MNDRNSRVGRPKTKAAGILFKFEPALEKYLRNEAKKSGKHMVRIVEELLEYRSRYKSFPPPAQRSAKTLDVNQKELVTA